MQGALRRKRRCRFVRELYSVKCTLWHTHCNQLHQAKRPSYTKQKGVAKGGGSGKEEESGPNAARVRGMVILHQVRMQ